MAAGLLIFGFFLSFCVACIKGLFVFLLILLCHLLRFFCDFPKAEATKPKPRQMFRCTWKLVSFQLASLQFLSLARWMAK